MYIYLYIYILYHYADGSKILSINGNRTIAMSYELVKKSLAASDYPLILGMYIFVFIYKYIDI
jgi:hypothetical protein